MPQFTVDREALVKELGIIQAAVERKGTIPALGFCLFEVSGSEAKITGTDLDVTIVTTIPVSGSDGDWSFAVPARQLYSLVALLDGETISLSEDKGRIKIQQGSSKHLLPALERSSFPIPDRAQPETVEVDGETLGQMLKAVNLGISTKNDEHRAEYKSVSFILKDGKLELTTSDSTELANAVVPIPDKKAEFIGLLPKRASQVLGAFLGAGIVKVGFAENHALFVNGNRELTARLTYAKFPDWKLIIPKGDGHKISISNIDLQAATKRVMITAEEFRLVNPVKCSLSKSELTLESRGGDKGQSTETLSIECPSLNGDTIELGINGPQLLDFLNVAKDTVGLEIWKATSPIRFTLPSLPFDYQYITQPTRID